MRKIIEILFVEKTPTYTRTHVLLDTGEECVGYGEDFNVGDLCEHWFDEKWGVAKVRKSKPRDL